MILVRFSLSPWLPIPWVFRLTFSFKFNSQNDIRIIHVASKRHPTRDNRTWFIRRKKLGVFAIIPYLWINIRIIPIFQICLRGIEIVSLAIFNVGTIHKPPPAQKIQRQTIFIVKIKHSDILVSFYQLRRIPVSIYTYAILQGFKTDLAKTIPGIIIPIPPCPSRLSLINIINILINHVVVMEEV